MVTSTPRTEIEQGLRRWEECFNSGNFRGLSKLYAVDGALMPPDSGIIRGRPAIEAFWAQAQAGGVQRIQLHLGDVEADENLAVEVSTATLTVAGPDGSTSEVPVKYAVTWKRTNGRWELLVDIYNSM